MGSRNNLSFRSQDYFHRLSKSLEFAVSEWILMFFLFIDACFGYLIAKFASYCELQGPCVLCSRFDRILAMNKTGVHWDSICNHHKSEISSVVLSHVHDKYTSSKNVLLTSSSVSDASLPLLASEEHVKNEKHIFVDEPLESFRSSQVENNRVAPSSEIEYQKVNGNSDSELELPVSGAHPKPVSQFEVLDSEESKRPSRTGEMTKNSVSEPHSSEIERVNVNSDSEPELPVSKAHSKPISQFEVLDSEDSKCPSRTGEMTKSPISENEPIATNGHQVPNFLDLGDAYKLAISSKGRQLSEKLLDQKSFQDSSSRVSEDLKLLLISPKPSFNSDDLTGIQFLQRRISLERNESNLSLDGSIVSEIDGESVVDRLKRQVEHDRKLMGALYKELEEERNASAVATNQAMAMITRLQEEKATLYTEALQYLRMMEEQAEYNSEALQKANDLIEEKEKQIQDLEEVLRKTSEDVRE